MKGAFDRLRSQHSLAFWSIHSLYFVCNEYNYCLKDWEVKSLEAKLCGLSPAHSIPPHVSVGHGAAVAVLCSEALSAGCTGVTPQTPGPAVGCSQLLGILYPSTPYWECRDLQARAPSETLPCDQCYTRGYQKNTFELAMLSYGRLTRLPVTLRSELQVFLQAN